MSKRDAAGHVKRCIVPNLAGTRGKSFIQMINDRDMYGYWMCVKIKGSARLEDLDAFEINMARVLWPFECV